ncbi:hypothetical protein PIB30_094709, partial [Stylosanthes scabra]|nr:hypothetical protein [Stylosanthes scabra]
ESFPRYVSRHRESPPLSLSASPDLSPADLLPVFPIALLFYSCSGPIITMEEPISEVLNFDVK